MQPLVHLAGSAEPRTDEERSSLVGQRAKGMAAAVVSGRV